MKYANIPINLRGGCKLSKNQFKFKPKYMDKI
jgi:hypothetical protein